MTEYTAPADRDAVVHVRQLTADELEKARSKKRFFKESAWDEWRTTQALEFDGPNDDFTVCRNFATDLVSVPNIVAWFIPRAGRYARASVLHDYLWRRPMRVDHRQADRRFRLQMQRDGVSLLRRWIMWATVRMSAILRCKGGAGSWKDFFGAAGLLIFIALPIVFLPVVTILVSTIAFWILESIIALVVPDETPIPIQWKT